VSGQNVVIVESPAKAKTINKYLGNDFKVLASFGHVRDLPPKDGSVRPDEDFEMDWQLGERSKKHIDEIVGAVKDAKRVYLATDPDREGEAIAWHVKEILQQKKLLDRRALHRVTFNEITRSAVTSAIENPRDVNKELVEAYLARRALDYLVGFTLSPVLWRKLPGSRSAGRVQSVALRLICEREAEIETFRPQEYWSIEVVFTTADGAAFTARLTELDGKKLDKFALGDKGAAEAVASRIAPLLFHVAEVERKQVRRNPPPPFTTSTLQQEASRKLGLGATRTMRIAQKLYEGIELGGDTVGLITYMRTDGVQLAGEAIDATRKLIGEAYGATYRPDQPRVYKSAAKNAQEAHEAIRPTDVTRRPEHVAAYLDKDDLRLYELIWKRTVACQMASAVLDQVAVDVASEAGDVVLRATGSILIFDGFLRVYREGRDDTSDEDEKDTRLPPVSKGGGLERGEIRPEQHFTQPPPRYTEASLVKKLEELGIGRPSTYASILQVLQDRDYVRLDKKRFIPEDRGRLVTAFLVSFFQRYVEYSFTAELENQLDEISGGRIDWKQVLRDFWRAFSGAVDETKDLTITQVIDTLDEVLGHHFFGLDGNGDEAAARVCPACADGRLGLKLSRNGAFIGCNRYPECKYTRPLSVAGSEGEGADPLLEGPRQLGNDPETGLPVTVKRGPYGTYVQLGPPPEHAEPKKGKDRPVEKPKRVSIPKGMNPAELDLETALALLGLPRTIGQHPETGEPITAGIGRFGPYVKHGSTYKSLPDDEDVLTLGMNRAVTLLAEKEEGKGRRQPATPQRSLGEHPADGKPVTVGSGRFGPYVKHNKTYASLPKGVDPETITLEEALERIAAKADKAGTKSTGKTATKTTATKATKSTGKTTKAKAAEQAEAEAEAETTDKSGAKRATAAKSRSGSTGKTAKPAASDDASSVDAEAKRARKTTPRSKSGNGAEASARKTTTASAQKNTSRESTGARAHGSSDADQPPSPRPGGSSRSRSRS